MPTFRLTALCGGRVVAVLSALALPAGGSAHAATTGARAATRHEPIILAPARATVNERIRFSVAPVAANTRAIVYLIDGRSVWRARHAPYKFAGTGWLDTAR